MRVTKAEPSATAGHNGAWQGLNGDHGSYSMRGSPWGCTMVHSTSQGRHYFDMAISAIVSGILWVAVVEC